MTATFGATDLRVHLFGCEGEQGWFTVFWHGLLAGTGGCCVRHYMREYQTGHAARMVRIPELLHEPVLLIQRVMHAVGRATGHKLYVHNLLFVVLVRVSCTRVLLVPRLQTLFKRCLNVGSLWRSSMKLMAKLFIELNYACAVHRQELPANNQKPPGTTSTHPDTARTYQHITTRKYPKASKRP